LGADVHEIVWHPFSYLMFGRHCCQSAAGGNFGLCLLQHLGRCIVQ
jgi:hypothetical protein